MGSETTTRDDARLGHVVVAGASMAGLLAARVLSDRADRVTIVEQDRFPHAVDNRRGVPQGRHAHGLLASGYRVMRELYRGLEDELVERGAVAGDVIGDSIWHLGGSYKLRFPSGLRGIVVSRPLLETTLRERTTASPRITTLEETSVRRLSTNGDTVTGVIVESRDRSTTTLAADLVVDATGRGSRTPTWLGELGFPAPVEQRVEVGIGYTTLTVRRRPGDANGAVAIIVGVDPPAQRRLGVALAMEGDRWMVTLGGFLGDHAPTDRDGFLAFARSLSAPDLYELLRESKPLSDFATYKFPANLRRRYDQLSRFPDGFLVIGDGLCSFNPIYGQGMSVSALEAEALGQCLDAGRPDTPLWRAFYPRAAGIADIAWTLAASADLALEGVQGKKPPGFPVVNWYMNRVQNLASRDRQVCRAFFDVTNLLAPPTRLFAPGIAVKVLVRGHDRPPAAK